MELVAIGERMLARLAVRDDLGELGVLDQERGRVDADTGHAAVEPEAEDVLVLGPHVGVRPVEVRLLRREEMQVPLAVPTRVHAEPAEDRLPSVGRAVTVRPEPGRNQNRSLAGDPGGEASASRNHGCWSETWFGTMSTIVRMPSSRASAMSSSASSSVPNTGSIAR